MVSSVARKREGGLLPDLPSGQLRLTLSIDHNPPRSRFLAICLGTAVAPSSVVTPSKRFVYILRSLGDRDRYYTGVTSNVQKRLAEHNAGECVHTVRHRPWELDLVIVFREPTRALAFERYLKSGSGSAFAQRHLR